MGANVMKVKKLAGKAQAGKEGLHDWAGDAEQGCATHGVAKNGKDLIVSDLAHGHTFFSDDLWSL